MDLIAVTGVNYFLRRRRKYRYLILTAGISSIFGLALILVIKNYLLYCLVSHFLLNTCMVLVCFGRCSRREFLENWAVTYLVVILLGGILEWLGRSGILPQNLFLYVLAGAVGIYGILLYLMQRKNFGNHIMEARISKDERRMEVKAYWDSGNQLRDPYTGQGINILSHTKAKEFLNETRDRMRFVPYRSLGEEAGLIWVTDVDELLLYDGNKSVRMEHIAIGVANQGLLEDKEYDLILHASMGME